MKLSSVLLYATVAAAAIPCAAAAALPTSFDVQAAYCEALLTNQRDAVRQLPGVVGGGPELVRVVDARVAKLGDQLRRIDDYLAPRRARLDPEPLHQAAQTVSLDQIVSPRRSPTPAASPAAARSSRWPVDAGSVRLRRPPSANRTASICHGYLTSADNPGTNSRRRCFPIDGG